MFNSFWNKEEKVDSKEEIISVFKLSIFFFFRYVLIAFLWFDDSSDRPFAIDIFLREMGSLCFVIDGMSWCILRFNGRWLLSISCGKRQVTCREVRIFHLFNIEINNTFINTIWIIVSTWFVYDISLNNKFINSVVKVFFACIFKICRFYQLIINLAEIGAFMLFLQMIKNNIVVQNGKIIICNGSCCHSNCFKIINIDWELCNLYNKSILNKTITKREEYVKYNFAATLNVIRKEIIKAHSRTKSLKKSGNFTRVFAFLVFFFLSFLVLFLDRLAKVYLRIYHHTFRRTCMKRIGLAHILFVICLLLLEMCVTHDVPLALEKLVMAG